MRHLRYAILTVLALNLVACMTTGPEPQPGASVRVGGEGADYFTLREALAEAPAEVGYLLLNEGVFEESGLVIARHIVIRGAGMERTIIQGAPGPGVAQDRIFLVEENAEVRIEHLTIENGVATEIPRRGGGILNFGELWMDSCRVRNNQAVYGVGLDNRGIAVITNSEFRGNDSLRMNTEERTTGVGCTGSGGAIKNEPGGILSVTRSGFFENFSQAKGGALFVSCESRATLHACTIQGNEAADAGGGIYLRGELVLTECRITGNTSREGGGGVHVRGFLDYSRNVIRGNNRVDLVVGTGSSGFHGDGIIGIDDRNRVGEQWQQ
jgi:hypothetical protein